MPSSAVHHPKLPFTNMCQGRAGGISRCIGTIFLGLGVLAAIASSVMLMIGSYKTVNLDVRLALYGGLSSKDVDGTLHFAVGEDAGTVARSACRLGALLSCDQLVRDVFRNDTIKSFNRTSTDLGKAYIPEEQDEVVAYMVEQCVGGVNLMSLNTFPQGKVLADVLCAPAVNTLGAQAVDKALHIQHPWASITTASGAWALQAPWVPRAGIVYLGVWTGVMVLLSLVFTIQSVGCLCCNRPTEVSVSATEGGAMVADHSKRCFNWVRFVTGTVLATTFTLLVVNVYVGFEAAGLAAGMTPCHDAEDAVYSQWAPDSNCTLPNTGANLGALTPQCATQAAVQQSALPSVAEYYAPTPNCLTDQAGEQVDMLAASFLTYLAVWGGGMGLGFVALTIFSLTAAAFDSTEELVAAVWSPSRASPPPAAGASGPYSAATPLSATGPEYSAPSYT